jgi:hypothetical protein
MRKSKTRLVLNIIIIAAFVVFLVAKSIWNIVNGRAESVVLLALMTIPIAMFVMWDRWHWRRWPGPTELPPPRVVTAEVESLERKGG